MGLLQNGYGSNTQDVDQAGIPQLQVTLTRLGREKLATEGVAAFVKWGLSDDGIDYSLFDPALADPGEIIKAIPIMQPISDDAIGLRSRLISINDPAMTYLPTVQFSIGRNQNSIGLTEQAGTPQPVTAQVHFTQQGFRVPAGLVDTKFLVEVDSVLLSIARGNQSLTPNTANATAVYVLDADAGTSPSGGGVVSFSIIDSPLTDLDWDTNSIGTVGSRVIRTEVRVTGVESGLSNSVPVLIQEKAGLHS